MTTETLPPIEWETPHPSVTNLVRAGIYEHLMSQMDKHLQPENSHDQNSGD